MNIFLIFGYKFVFITENVPTEYYEFADEHLHVYTRRND